MIEQIVRKSVYWSVIVTALGLGGCAHKPDVMYQNVPTCVTQYHYTKEDMAALLKEMIKYGDNEPTTVRMLGNYSDVRQQNAMCWYDRHSIISHMNKGWVK